jgi:hypothetical protein
MKLLGWKEVKTALGMSAADWGEQKTENGDNLPLSRD